VGVVEGLGHGFVALLHADEGRQDLHLAVRRQARALAALP
jgi:hypothetical protein